MCGQTDRSARSISDRMIRTTRIAMCLFNGVRTRMFRRTALQKRKTAEQKMSAIQSLFDLATRATDGEPFAEVGIVLLHCIGKHMPASPIRHEIERLCFTRVQHSLKTCPPGVAKGTRS